MLPLKSSTTLTILTVLTIARTASATSIVVDALQEIHANGQIIRRETEGPFVAAIPPSPTNSGVTETASQDTTISPFLFGGTGAAFTSFIATSQMQTASRNAGAQLFSNFILTDSYFANLTGLLESTGYGHAEGFLVLGGDTDTPTYLAFENADNQTASLSFSGVLSPGFYTFYLLAQSQTAPTAGPGEGSATFNATLTLTPTGLTAVPEPGSVTLLLTGMGALAGHRWRRRIRRGGESN